jgi:hypothetical protein
MKYLSIPAFCFIALFFGVQSLLAADDISSLDASEIAKNVYHREVGRDMQAMGSMELISESGHVCERRMITLRKDTDSERRVLIRFTSPADIENTAFLVIEDTTDNTTRQHLYLPALKRTRRIVSAQQGRSFVNSDFTYEDMQRHPVDEWNYELKGSEAVLERPCYVLISTPKPDTDTQYQKIVSWIDKEHFMPLRTEFWNKRGNQFKTYQVKEFAIIDGIATEMEVVMEDHSDQHLTRITTDKIRYNSGIPDSLLTTRALEN